MGKFSDVWWCIFWVICGIFICVIGVLCVIYQPLISVVLKEMEKELALSEHSTSYRMWRSPVKVSYKVYLFNILNADEVMEGEPPKFVEMGPYVYDEVLQNHAIAVDELSDEMTYMIESKFQFNQRESGKAKESDKITLLNSAYIGVINTLAGLPPNFMMQYGPNVAKLFSQKNPVFVQGKAGDILFYGLKITCNTKKFPELSLICMTLKGKNKPPIIRDGEKENQYFYSFFHKMNSTMRGPITINRGTKNISRVGDVTALKNERIQKVWRTEECNTVSGIDGMKWPPMFTQLPTISSFASDMCRKLKFRFKEEVVIHGVLGWRYEISSENWEEDKMECYCPEVNGEAECLPHGLLDVSKCQEVPVIYSEPHFLNGDPELLKYARGLQPDQKRHASYLVIEPRTGTPLAGFRRMQLNMRLSRQSLDLLGNVSEGYFPLIWCDEGSTIDVSLIKLTYQVQRLICLLWFLQWVPLIIGIYVILAALFFYIPPRPRQDEAFSKVQSIFTLTGSFSRRQPGHDWQMRG